MEFSYDPCGMAHNPRRGAKYGSLAHTDWRKQELVKGHSLHRRYSSTRLRHGKRPTQKSEPLVLYRCHEETICHEPCQPLKVEWRRCNSFVIRDEIFFWPWNLAIEFVNLNGKEIFARVWSTRFGSRFPTHGAQSLGHCICYSTKYLFHHQNLVG